MLDENQQNGNDDEVAVRIKNISEIAKYNFEGGIPNHKQLSEIQELEAEE